MANDLKERSGAPEADGGRSDPVQQHYDDTFAQLTSSEHQAKTGTSGDTSRSASPEALKKSEKNPSPGDNDTVGKGFPTGKADRGQRKNVFRRMAGASRTKKRIAAAAAVGVGGIIGSAIGFFALLPLKVTSLITNVTGTYSAAEQGAVGSESQNLVDKYLINKVLPGVGKPRCHTTVSAGCLVAKSSGKDPISKLYNSWRENRLENKLATKYGIVMGKKGNNYFINLNGKGINLGDHPTSIFDHPGTTKGTKAEISSVLDDAIKQETLWNKTLFRFKYGPFIKNKYSVERCTIACKVEKASGNRVRLQPVLDSIATQKLAAKGYVIGKVISPISEQYGLILQCVLAGGNCGTDLEKNATPGEAEKTSDFQKKLDSQLADYAAKFATEEAGQDALKKLTAQADKISADGFKDAVLKTLAAQIGEKLGIQGADKAIPIVGQVLLVAQLISSAQHIGPILKYMGYAINAAAAVKLYTTYAAVASETKSGNVTAAELGGFSDSLSTNLTGAASDQSDMTQTPLYQNLYGSSSGTSTALLDSILPTKAYAASNTGYLCNNGKGVPVGQLVCPEELLSRGNHFASDISTVVGYLPGFTKVTADIIVAIQNKVGSLLFTVGCDTSLVCKPALNQFSRLAAPIEAKLTNLIITTLISPPFSDNMSGGRTGDMITAGADVSYNKSCQDQLGCSQLNNQQVADIRNQQTEQKQNSFNHLSLFARVFSTDSPYSLVSRVATIMPANWASASSSMASTFLSNPLAHFGNVIGSVFSGNHVFAAASAQSDPFGVIQYGYPASMIPPDPEAYWNSKCVTGPMATYDSSTDQLDVSAWASKQKQSTNTGEAVATTPNPCLLIQSTVQSDGALFDTSLISKGTANADQ